MGKVKSKRTGIPVAELLYQFPMGKVKAVLLNLM